MTLSTSEERQAERTLLNQTRELSSDELESFLQYYNIPREEYAQLLEKYKHLLAAYNKLNP